MSLEVHNLSYAYPGSSETIFKNAEFTCCQGEVQAIIGGNGSGKTTFLRLLLGELEPDLGTISWKGEPSKKAFFRPGVLGYLPQEPALYQHLTVTECLNFGNDLASSLGKEPWEQPDRLLLSFHLVPWQNYKVRELSRGTRQRLSLAQLFLLRPEILIVDEPTTGLDLKEQISWFRYLTNFVEATHASVVLVSHSLAELESVADKINLIDKGKLQTFQKSEGWKDEVTACLSQIEALETR